MAAVRGLTWDKTHHFLRGCCVLTSRIPGNARGISQEKMHVLTSEHGLFRKAISGSLCTQGPFKVMSFLRPMSSQSQGSFSADLKSSPSSALYLGFSGAIPFCSLATMAFISPEHLNLIAHAQQAYGACILSFLGAVHWGYTLPKTSELKPDWNTLGYSVTPSLIAWLSLLMNPAPGLTTLCFGLAVALWKDLKTSCFPSWYIALRKALSTLAVTSVGLTAAVLYFQ
ncbi:transmembrane protein 69 [Pocillopora verrucosa]|uniref:transmembrane protein 69 n=1 Tax=Pocillopora verrucosa TaxID=203993 RepID=UPI00333EE8C8